MKKSIQLVFFLMFSGLLGVNAQVRIGSDATPNASAILDLNATDAKNDNTFGLALPRVSLSALTAKIHGTDIPPEGMLVYNTNTATGVGLYYWKTNTWIKVNEGNSLGNGTAANQVLKWNGSAWVASVVDSTTIAAGALSGTDLANGAITTTQIRDLNVTTAKLANNAVDSTKIQDASISFADLRKGTATGQMLQWNGTAWNLVANPAANNWSMAGNSVADGDFIGTTNNKPLILKVNNDTAGIVTTSTANRTALGYQALKKATGANNTAVGIRALGENTSGAANTAIGRDALAKNTTAARNTAVGSQSLQNASTGGDNTAVGYNALLNDTTGAFNTAIGAYALNANTTASGNTAIGYRALPANISGQYNTALGDSAGAKTTGSRNILIGHLAGVNITTGSNNIVIGDNALTSSVSASNQLNIGNWIYGDNGRIRLGKTAPHTAAVLDLNANDTSTPIENIGGLSLPRISLDTINSKLNGISPMGGTVVYNTNASMKGGQGNGLYIWSNGRWKSFLNPVLATSIAFEDGQSVTLPLNVKYTLSVNFAPEDVSITKLSFSSIDPTVASVNSLGRVSTKAVGTTTITAVTTDGSNKSKSISVLVEDMSTLVDSVGNHTYSVRAYPDNLGTWMLTNSQEGTPTVKYGTQYYYNYTDRHTACPAPYRVPSTDEMSALIAYMNTIPKEFNSFNKSMLAEMNLAGYIKADENYPRWLGTRGFWWTSSGTTSRRYGTVNTNDVYYVSISHNIVTATSLPVRCLRTTVVVAPPEIDEED